MGIDEVTSDVFTDFVSDVEAGLRHALTAALGYELGREAAAEALAYGWEHWDRIRDMENRGGYLYRVGLNWGRRQRSRQAVSLAPVQPDRYPDVEPGLPDALEGLSEKQRVVVFLVHGHDWSLSEAADLLDVSKGTVQKHLERAIRKLKRQLGVDE